MVQDEPPAPLPAKKEKIQSPVGCHVLQVTDHETDISYQKENLHKMGLKPAIHPHADYFRYVAIPANIILFPNGSLFFQLLDIAGQFVHV